MAHYFFGSVLNFRAFQLCMRFSMTARSLNIHSLEWASSDKKNATSQQDQSFKLKKKKKTGIKNLQTNQASNEVKLR